MTLTDRPVLENDPAEMWRRQNARNIMDCYALGLEVMAGAGTKDQRKVFDSLIRLMVDGLTAGDDPEDEKSFFRMAATACRECAGKCLSNESLEDKARLFRIYAAVFDDMGQ